MDPFCYLCFTFFFIMLPFLFLAGWERTDLLALLCVILSRVLSLSHMVSWTRRGT